MSDPIISLIISLLGIIVGLIVEYWVIQPLRNSKKPQQISQMPLHRGVSNTVLSARETGYSSSSIAPNGAKGKLSIADVWYYILLFIISAAAALSSALILRLVSEEYYYGNATSILGSIAELIAYSDFVFVIVCLIMVLSGVVLWFLIDTSLDLRNAAPWQRFLLSGIIGFIGAWLGLVMVLIALLYFVLKGDNYRPWPTKDKDKT